MRFSIFRVTAPLRHGNIFWQQKVIFSITTAATGLLRPEMETLADLSNSSDMYLTLESQNFKSYSRFSIFSCFE